MLVTRSKFEAASMWL